MNRPYATRPRPTLHTIGDGHYILDLDPAKVQMEIVQVRRDRFNDLRGILTVRGAIAGATELDTDGTIWFDESVNLSNPARRKQLAMDLARCSKLNGNDFDWHAHCDLLAFKVATAESQGQPAAYLGDIPPASTTDRVLDVDGFSLLACQPQIIFGDGGTMKSYFALHLAGELAKRGIVPIFADWELDGGEHRLRADRLYGATTPPIVYVRCTRPLINEIDRLARVKHTYNAQYLVCDSISVAAHGKVEESDTPKEYFRAIRSLNIGSLHIAHTTKTGDQAEYRPFGSAFWHDLAKGTWFAKAEEATVDTTGRAVTLLPRKHLDQPWKALGYRFDFSGNALRIHRIDPASVPSLAASLPAWQRIKACVINGPLSYAEIVEETGLREGTVREEVRRRKRLFLVSEGANGAKRVGLLERRFSS